jgi:hypothetical protein
VFGIMRLVSRWIANKKHVVNSIVSSATSWISWKCRNKLCFQGACWTGEREVLIGIAKTLRMWRPVYNMEIGEQVEAVVKASPAVPQ